jgi:hypothetical protein
VPVNGFSYRVTVLLIKLFVTKLLDVVVAAVATVDVSVDASPSGRLSLLSLK